MTKPIIEASASQAPDHSLPDLMAFVDIREAIGDPEGKLMQSEVVERVRELICTIAVLEKQVKALQSHPDSYQSGFDDGRASVRVHVDRWKDWARAQVKARNE